MGISSILIVLIGAILYQTNPSGCLFPKLTALRSNNLDKSTAATDDYFTDLRHSLAILFRSPFDKGVKKLRLYYSNKYAIKASLRSTITVSSTTTTVITTAKYCAYFINNGVTGACRRRKQLLHDSKVVHFNDSPGDEVQPTQVLNR